MKSMKRENVSKPSRSTTYGIWTDSPTAVAGIQGSSITGFTKTIQFGNNISIQSTL